MSIQYLSDEKGQVTAVQLPIEEWELIKIKYPDVDHLDAKLPQWHKDLIDARLDAIEKNPQLIRPISELLDELDK
ncbi:addiction module component CHP02574 family protein [Inquilinus sp. KBS0705]|nr:addiction module component CHP02574 family protein [Inquilinus sp. KBS0705]